MSEPEQIIPSGPFKGKKIVLAPTDGVNAFRDVAEEFMGAIFEMEPGSYLITDESGLHDFEDVEEVDSQEIHAKIRSIFGVDVRDVGSGNLLEIFARIHRRRFGEPG